jgi:hypothetical protein
MRKVLEQKVFSFFIEQILWGIYILLYTLFSYNVGNLIVSSMLTVGDVDSGGKFTACVIDSGNKFTARVIDNGNEFIVGAIDSGNKFTAGAIDFVVVYHQFHCHHHKSRKDVTAGVFDNSGCQHHNVIGQFVTCVIAL